MNAGLETATLRIARLSGTTSEVFASSEKQSQGTDGVKRGRGFPDTRRSFPSFVAYDDQAVDVTIFSNFAGSILPPLTTTAAGVAIRSIFRKATAPTAQAPAPSAR